MLGLTRLMTDAGYYNVDLVGNLKLSPLSMLSYTFLN